MRNKWNSFVETWKKDTNWACFRWVWLQIGWCKHFWNEKTSKFTRPKTFYMIARTARFPNGLYYTNVFISVAFGFTAWFGLARWFQSGVDGWELRPGSDSRAESNNLGTSCVAGRNRPLFLFQKHSNSSTEVRIEAIVKNFHKSCGRMMIFCNRVLVIELWWKRGRIWRENVQMGMVFVFLHVSTWFKETWVNISKGFPLLPGTFRGHVRELHFRWLHHG